MSGKIPAMMALLVLAFPLASPASRMEPKKVPPVIHRGVVYRVNHEKMGFLEAWDEKTGKLLWEKRIYRVFYNPFLERDVQDVYISRVDDLRRSSYHQK